MLGWRINTRTKTTLYVTPVSIDPTLTSSPHAIFPCCISSAPSRPLHRLRLPLARPSEPGFRALLFPPQVAVRAIKEKDFNEQLVHG